MLGSNGEILSEQSDSFETLRFVESPHGAKSIPVLGWLEDGERRFEFPVGNASAVSLEKRCTKDACQVELESSKGTMIVRPYPDENQEGYFFILLQLEFSPSWIYETDYIEEEDFLNTIDSELSTVNVVGQILQSDSGSKDEFSFYAERDKQIIIDFRDDLLPITHDHKDQEYQRLVRHYETI